MEMIRQKVPGISSWRVGFVDWSERCADQYDQGVNDDGHSESREYHQNR